MVGIRDTPEGLVATYRLSDSHTALFTHVMTARSADGGRTWEGHRSIAHRNVWEHQACWVAPQLSRLRDGRLVVLVDEGRRGSGQDWPLLTRWQQRPARGMANYLLWSGDHGRTWSEPQPVDAVGSEPGYLIELADGTLYTRTESASCQALDDPPAPWGAAYYRNVAVGSTDGGSTSAARPAPVAVLVHASSSSRTRYAFRIRWRYKTSLHATTRMQVAGAPVPEDIHTLRRDDWQDVPGGGFALCSNEIPTKINWHYLRWRFDLQARRNVELQVNDRVLRLRRLAAAALPLGRRPPAGPADGAPRAEGVAARGGRAGGRRRGRPSQGSPRRGRRV